MHARQTDAYFSEIIGSGLRSPVVRHSGSNSHRVANAGPRPSPSRQLKQLARDISVCCLFWTVFSRTGAEKLLGLSEPTPQIPGRALCHFWLWFGPSALGVNVDRTRDTRAFLTVKLPHFYHTSTAPTSPRPRCHLSGPGWRGLRAGMSPSGNVYLFLPSQGQGRTVRRLRTAERATGDHA